MPNGNGEGSQLPLWITRILIAVLLGLLSWVAMDWQKRLVHIETQVVAHVTKGDLAVLATQQCEARLDRMERIYREIVAHIMTAPVPAKPPSKPPPRSLPSGDEAY